MNFRSCLRYVAGMLDLNHYGLIFAVLLVFIFGLAACALLAYIQQWKLDVERVRKGGYAPPSPDFLSVVFLRIFTILLGFVEVGPLQIYGRRRIPKQGLVILVPMHIEPGDVSFVSSAIGPQPFWYMIRTTEMHSWRGWMGARTGALAIDEETEHGRSAGFKASLEAVTRKNGPRFTVIFAQGELVPSEEIVREGFKEGFYALARLASRKLKQPVYVQPIVLHYKRNPQSASLFQRMTLLFGFQHFRNLFGSRNFGGVAVIGRPMIVDASLSSDDLAKKPAAYLPKDSGRALDLFVEKLQFLQRVTLQLAKDNPVESDEKKMLV